MVIRKNSRKLHTAHTKQAKYWIGLKHAIDVIPFEFNSLVLSTKSNSILKKVPVAGIYTCSR